MPRTFHRTKPQKVVSLAQMEPVERVHRPLKKMLRDNFLGGIAWALGATIGVAIIVAILGFVLQFVDTIPFIGNTLADIVNATNQSLKNR